MATPQGVIGIWDWANGKEVLKVQAHAGRVLSIAFSPDDKTLASVADGPIRQWDVATGQALGDQTGHQEPVVSVAYAPNGATIFTAGWDGTVRQWEAPTGKEIRRWENPRATGWQNLDFAWLGAPSEIPEERPEETKYVRFWDLASGKETQIQLAKSNISDLTVSPVGRLLAATANETGDRRSFDSGKRPAAACVGK